jgi:formamidopyrimidine-DNA glycosylase
LKRLKNIKALLMDQTIIAGIGNEYADEILLQAGIDPHHAAKDLSVSTRNTLYKQMRSVLTYATKVRLAQVGTAMGYRFFSKQDRELFKSSYLQAHRHVDMVCPKNKAHTLKRATIAGRTTFYCPVDQK